MRRQDGFTLFEMLAVLVILSILSAFTYSIFTGEDQTALDTEAKSHARSLLWKVHTCFTSTEDYTLCDEPTEQEPPPGVTWGDGPGEVEVVQGNPATTRYKVTIRSKSRATSDGTNHLFYIVKELDGDETRTCQSGRGNDAGGCSEGVW